MTGSQNILFFIFSFASAMTSRIAAGRATHLIQEIVRSQHVSNVRDLHSTFQPAVVEDYKIRKVWDDFKRHGEKWVSCTYFGYGKTRYKLKVCEVEIVSPNNFRKIELYYRIKRRTKRFNSRQRKGVSA
jgi:hypothetical protein